MPKHSLEILSCPKCGSGLLARGKPFRSTTPRLIVMLGKMHGICCVMCGYNAPTVRAWNSRNDKAKSNPET